jgi:hypothetical protein
MPGLSYRLVTEAVERQRLSIRTISVVGTYAFADNSAPTRIWVGKRLSPHQGYSGKPAFTRY